MPETILVTGGRGALARAIAAAFRSAGAEVLAPGRDELDVTDSSSVEAFFRPLKTLDLLVANAGAIDDAPLARTTGENWDRLLATNLHGAFRCARAASRPMLKARRGHLVFISSHSALHPPAGQAAYAAAKAGLLGLTRSLAKELGPAGIRANAILPGFLETPMTAAVTAARREAVRSEHALGRFNTPEAVAAFLVHLHRDLPHTSGQVFQLDSR